MERGERKEGRDTRRNCGWDGAAENRNKQPAVWAPPSYVQNPRWFGKRKFVAF